MLSMNGASEQLRKAEAIEKTSERDIEDYSNQRDQIEVRNQGEENIPVTYNFPRLFASVHECFQVLSLGGTSVVVCLLVEYGREGPE